MADDFIPEADWLTWFDQRKEQIAAALGIAPAERSDFTYPWKHCYSELSMPRADEAALAKVPALSKRLKKRYEFNRFHADRLLGDAARFLDRALADRAEHYRLAVEAKRLWLEVVEFAMLDQIHAKETGKHYYELRSKDATVQDQVLDKEIAANAEVKKLVDKTVADHYTNIDALAVQAASGGWATTTASPGINPAKVSREGIELNTPAEHAFYSVVNPTRQALSAQKSALDARLEELKGTIDAATKRKEYTQLRSEWELANEGFLRDRADVARQLNMDKVLSALRPGGEFNYWQKMGAIRERIAEDVAHAVALITTLAADDSTVPPLPPVLPLLYGYDEPPPPAPTTALGFDLLLRWVREATNYLAALSTRMQHHVISVSLRRLLTGKAWKVGAQAGIWSFPVSPALLPGQRFTRMRGVTVYGESKKDRGIWRMKITCPEVSVVVNAADKPVAIDQSSLSSVIVGRVLSRQHPRSADLVGETSLYNGSPFSVENPDHTFQPNSLWHVEVLRAVPPLADEPKLEDVSVDIHVSSVVVNGQR